MRILGCWWKGLVLGLLALGGAAPVQGAGSSRLEPATLQDEDAQRLDRLRQAVRRNPRPGTPLDRWYEAEIAQQSAEGLIAQLESATRDAAADPVELSLLALVLERSGRLEEALTTLQRLRTLDADSILPDLRQARLYERLRQFRQAADAADAALDRELPEDEAIEMAKLHGRLRLRIGEVEAGLRAWRELANLHRDDRHIQEEVAELLAAEGQWESAIDYWRAAAALDRDELFLQYRVGLRIGEALDRLDRPEEALQTLTALLERVDVDSWQAVELRDQVRSSFVRRGDLDGLAQHLDAWLQTNPGDTRARIELAQILRSRGEAEAAVEQLRVATELSPGEASLRLELALVLAELDRPAEAEAECDALLALHPGHAEASLSKGRMILRQSTPETRADDEGRVLQTWRACVAANPDDDSLPSRFAQACIDEDRLRRWSAEQIAPPGDSLLIEQAESFLRDAVGRHPERVEAHEALARFLDRTDRREEAVAAIEALAAPPHDTPDRITRQVTLFEELGRPQRALEAAVRVAELSPLEFRSGERVAEMQLAQSEPEAARDSAEKLRPLAETPALERRVVDLLVRAHGEIGDLEAVFDARSGDATTRLDHWLAAEIATALERPDAALPHWRAAAAVDPDAEMPARALAQGLVAAGEIEEGLDVLHALAESNPAAAGALLREAVSIALSHELHDRARAAARRLVQLMPDRADSYRVSGQIAAATRDLDAQIDFLRRGLRADSRDLGMRRSLVELLQEKGDVPEAYRQAWQVFEQATDLQDLRGAVAKLHELSESLLLSSELIERLRAATATGAKADDVHLCLAELMIRQNEPAQALEELEALSDQRRTNRDVLAMLVQAADDSEQPEKALHWCERLADVDPTPAHLDGLITRLRDLGQPERAADLLLRLFAAGADPSRMNEEIDHFLSEGSLDEAARLVDAALVGQADDPGVRLRAALVRFARDEVESARDHLVAVLDATEAETSTPAAVSIRSPRLFLRPEDFLGDSGEAWVLRGEREFAACGAGGFLFHDDPSKHSATRLGHELFFTPLMEAADRNDPSAWPPFAAVQKINERHVLGRLIAQTTQEGPRERSYRVAWVIDEAIDGPTQREIAWLVAASLDEPGALLPDADDRHRRREWALALASTGAMQRAVEAAAPLEGHDPLPALLELLRIEFEPERAPELARLRAALELLSGTESELASAAHACALRLLVAGHAEMAAAVLMDVEPKVEAAAELLLLAGLAPAAGPEVEQAYAARVEALIEKDASDPDSTGMTDETRCYLLVAAGRLPVEVEHGFVLGVLDHLLDATLPAPPEPTPPAATSPTPPGITISSTGVSSAPVTPSVEHQASLAVYAGGGFYRAHRFGFPRPALGLDGPRLYALQAVQDWLSRRQLDTELASFLEQRLADVGADAANRSTLRLARAAVDAAQGRGRRAQEELAALDREHDDPALLSARVRALLQGGEIAEGLELLSTAGGWDPAAFPPLMSDETTSPAPTNAVVEEIGNVLLTESRLGSVDQVLFGLVMLLDPANAGVDLRPWFPPTLKEAQRSLRDWSPSWTRQLGADVTTLVSGPTVAQISEEGEEVYCHVAMPEVLQAARRQGLLETLRAHCAAWRQRSPRNAELLLMDALLCFAAGEVPRGVAQAEEWLDQRGEVDIEDLSANWILQAAPVGGESAALVGRIGSALLSTSLEFSYEEVRAKLLSGWLGPPEGRDERARSVAAVLFESMRDQAPANARDGAVFIGHNLRVVVGEAPEDARGSLTAAVVDRWLRDPLARRAPIRTREGVSELIADGEALFDSDQRRFLIESCLGFLFPDGLESAPRLLDWRRHDPELARFPFIRLILELAVTEGRIDGLRREWREHPAADSVDLLFLRREAAELLEDADEAAGIETALRERTRWSTSLQVADRRARRGQHPQARSLYERALGEARDDLTRATVMRELALCLHAMGEPAEARQRWIEALELDPRGARIEELWPMVDEVVEGTDWSRLRAVLQRRVEADPADMDARAFLGAVLLRAGEAAAARPELERSRAAWGEFVPLRLVLYQALAALRSGDPDEAERLRDELAVRMGYEEGSGEEAVRTPPSVAEEKLWKELTGKD